MSKKLTFHSVSGIVSFQSNCHTLIARATELDACTSSPFLAVWARKAHVARTSSFSLSFITSLTRFAVPQYCLQLVA